MKWQLLATVIEDPGFTNRVSHVHLSMDREQPRLRCVCGQNLPIAYVSGDIEPPPFEMTCRHVRGLYDRDLLHDAKINFTAFGLEEFSWRWAVRKLALSAP